MDILGSAAEQVPASTVPLGSATEQVTTQLFHSSDQLRILIEFNRGMWWEMPAYLSDQLLKKFREDWREVSFMWDWEDARAGSYIAEDGEATGWSRYKLDIATMMQENTDSGRKRRWRIVHTVRGPL